MWKLAKWESCERNKKKVEEKYEVRSNSIGSNDRIDIAYKECTLRQLLMTIQLKIIDTLYVTVQGAANVLVFTLCSLFFHRIQASTNWKKKRLTLRLQEMRKSYCTVSNHSDLSKPTKKSNSVLLECMSYWRTQWI